MLCATENATFFTGFLCSMQLKCYVYRVVVLNATKNVTFPGFFVLNATENETISRVCERERAAHWNRQTYPEGARVPS